MLRHGRNVAVYLGGVDISGESNAVDPTMESDLADVTVFGPGTAGHVMFPGLAKDTATIEAIYNSTGATLFTNLIQQTPGYGMMIAFGQNLGDTAYAVNEVDLKSNKIKSVVTDVNRATINLETVNYPFEPATMLTTGKQTITATGQGTGVDNVTSTLNGGAVYAQIFAVSTPTIVLSIQTSSTGAFAGEQATSATFAAASSAGTQRVALSGTIERYSRSAWVDTGSTAVFAVALTRY